MLRLLRQVSLRELRTSWGRSALIVGGVATGVSLIAAISIINESVLTSFRRSIELIAGPAALEITLGIGEVGFDESAGEIARTDPDVVAAIPLVRGTISLAGDPTVALHLFGADLTTEEDLARYPIRTADRDSVVRGLDDPRSILLTASLAGRHGFRVGEQVELSTPAGLDTFTVRGLLETTGVATALGGQLAVMDLPAAQLLLGKVGKVDQIDLVLREESDVSTVARRLSDRLPESLTVQRPEQRGEHYERVLAAFQAMLTGLSTLCLLAGLFIIYNTTSTAAVRRAAVMGELRLLGAETGRLFRLLMIEAGVLAIVGALLGIASGIVLAHLLTGMVSDSMGVIFQLRFPIEHLRIDPGEQMIIASLSIGAALFGSYFAARRASAVEPLRIIRPEVLTSSAQASSLRLMCWWVLLVAASAVAIALGVHQRSFAWGNLGSSLWNVSIIVIALPMVSVSAVVLVRILPRLFGVEGRVALEGVLRARTRTAITVGAIAIVLALGITISTLVMSFRRSVASYFEEGFLLGDIVVSAASTEGGWLETPISATVGDEIRSIPGVRGVGELQFVPGQTYRGERVTLFVLSDGFLDPARYDARWYTAGNPVEAAGALRNGFGVNISKSFSNRFNLKTGDILELDTPTGRLALPIVGVVHDYMSDRGTIFVGRDLYVERWDDRMIRRAHVTLEPGADLEAVRAEITRSLGARHRLRVLSLRELIDYQAAAIDRAFAFTDALQLLIIIVSVAGILDLLTAAIIERRRELALWRVIGADERRVQRTIVIESGTIGALGAVLGVVVGFVTAWIWLRFNFPQLLGFELDYHFATGAALWYAALVMAVTMGAGYGAARFATRQPVLDSLDPEAAPAR